MKAATQFAVIALTCLCWPLLAVGDPRFPRRNIELLSHLPHTELGSFEHEGNDIWGWTDSVSGHEYALVGQMDGTAFVDITDATNPLFLGRLPSATGSSTWRDIKVYQDHAFIVADQNGPHGMQVFDLTRLRGVTSPQTWTQDANFGGSFRSAHNIVINEDSGYAYAVGSNRAAGGLYAINIQNPTSPFFAGQFSQDGYTHDAQVVNYQGPDDDYAGREIAFASNIDTLTIVDVTSKSNMQQISRNTYPLTGYAHQGWLSEDHRYFFMNDEADEIQFPSFGRLTRTLVWDVADLDNPVFVGGHLGTLRVTDHNLYVKDNLIYESNYAGGLRVLEIVDPANAELAEVAYIDTYQGDPLGYHGAWSSYPYFESGKIIVNDQTNGLFIVQLDFVEPDINGDGNLDCLDIDALSAAILSGSTESQFDLNSDGVVDIADRDAWLFEAGAQTLQTVTGFRPADGDLNGVVDGQDFIVWNNNKFEAHTGWCSGDYNTDGFVDGQDFILWNDNKFTATFGVAVPEPAASLMMLACLGVLWRRWSRTN